MTRSYSVILPARAKLGLAALACALSGCDGAPDGGEVRADGGTAALHLEARAGSGDGPFARASYKREPGEVAELEVHLDRAKAGSAHAVTLDGRELGKVVADLDGEGQLEFGEDAALPDGFVEPKDGSVLAIGDLFELRLTPLERVVHLEDELSAGKLSGKASFKRERLAGQETREFKVRVTGGPADAEIPVRVDGVEVGKLEVGSDGKGKLEYSEVERIAFPAGFPEPKAGSRIEVGELVSGALEDVSGAE